MREGCLRWFPLRTEPGTGSSSGSDSWKLVCGNEERTGHKRTKTTEKVCLTWSPVWAAEAQFPGNLCGMYFTIVLLNGGSLGHLATKPWEPLAEDCLVDVNSSLLLG